MDQDPRERIGRLPAVAYCGRPVVAGKTYDISFDLPKKRGTGVCGKMQSDGCG